MKRKDYPTLFGKINVQLAEDKSQTALVLEYQKEGEFSEEKLSKGGLSDRNQDKKRVGTYLSYYSAFDSYISDIHLISLMNHLSLKLPLSNSL